jgi:hypothetical protein
MVMLKRPFVLLIDDGELEDVAQLLEGLGVRPTRLLGGPGPEGWRQPQRLLVVSGRRAVQLGPAWGEERGAFARLAVADSPSKTLRTRLARLAFDSILCRPVHPEVLRLVVENALHGGREQRSRARFAAGVEVAWRSGLRRRRGTLTEISTRGCRLLVREVRRPPRLSLLLPRGLTGDRELRLSGHVVRCERKARGLVSLGVLFEGLERDSRRRLSGFLSSLRFGPPALAR